MDGMATAGLPDDPLVEILSRLHPFLRKKLAQTLEGFFVMDDGDDGGDSSFVNLLERSVPLDIDPSFSFLTSRPGIETLAFLDSCNGLLLFEHRQKSAPGDVLSYIVCNPATKEWGAVPTCDCPPLGPAYRRSSYLVFDPTFSPHFHLVLFRDESLPTTRPRELAPTVVKPHAYSSETGTWTHIPTDWNVQEEQGYLEEWRYCGRRPQKSPRCAFVNGMLHLLVLHPDDAVAVDVQGNTRRIIRVPNVVSWDAGYLAQSQGCLHYIKESFDGDTLSIWILKDYGTQEWVLQDTLNFSELFGEKSRSCGKMEILFVTIHPDRNVVFLAQASERKLISYDMDRKEVSVIGTLGNLNCQTHIVPYVPYFSKSPAFKCMH
ncbi:hypothetical protein EJB05_14712, partial [Eragrostis curvula]